MCQYVIHSCLWVRSLLLLGLVSVFVFFTFFLFPELISFIQRAYIILITIEIIKIKTLNNTCWEKKQNKLVE